MAREKVEKKSLAALNFNSCTNKNSPKSDKFISLDRRLNLLCYHQGFFCPSERKTKKKNFTRPTAKELLAKLSHRLTLFQIVALDAVSIKFALPATLLEQLQNIERAKEMVEEQRVEGAIDRWMREYRITHPPANVLRTFVVEHMQAFEFMAKEKKKALIEQANKPDEDGFILVTKSKRQLKRMKV